MSRSPLVKKAAASPSGQVNPSIPSDGEETASNSNQPQMCSGFQVIKPDLKKKQSLDEARRKSEDVYEQYKNRNAQILYSGGTAKLGGEGVGEEEARRRQNNSLRTAKIRKQIEREEQIRKANEAEERQIAEHKAKQRRKAEELRKKEDERQRLLRQQHAQSFQQHTRAKTQTEATSPETPSVMGGEITGRGVESGFSMTAIQFQISREAREAERRTQDQSKIDEYKELQRAKAEKLEVKEKETSEQHNEERRRKNEEFLKRLEAKNKK